MIWQVMVSLKIKSTEAGKTTTGEDGESSQETTTRVNKTTMVVGELNRITTITMEDGEFSNLTTMEDGEFNNLNPTTMVVGEFNSLTTMGVDGVAKETKVMDGEIKETTMDGDLMNFGGHDDSLIDLIDENIDSIKCTRLKIIIRDEELFFETF